MTAGEIRQHLHSKAGTDLEFGKSLLADPRAVIEEELGLTLPGGFEIKVHEEERGGPRTWYSRQEGSWGRPS